MMKLKMMKLTTLLTIFFITVIGNVYSSPKIDEHNNYVMMNDMSGDQCANIFYPDTRYYMKYNVSDKYINGVLCYANWYWNRPGGLWSVYKLNTNNCSFYYVDVYTYYYFLWQPY